MRVALPNPGFEFWSNQDDFESLPLPESTALHQAFDIGHNLFGGRRPLPCFVQNQQGVLEIIALGQENRMRVGPHSRIVSGMHPDVLFWIEADTV